MVGKRIKAVVHAQIWTLHQEGYSSRQIAERLRIGQPSVVRSIKMHNDTGKFEYEKPRGRRRCTTTRMDTAIIKAAKKSPRKSSLGILVSLPTDARPSSRTIRRRLFQSGLKSYRPSKKPFLTVKNIKDRLTFCRKYKDFSNQDWSRVMFSDEATICQFYSFTRHVRRPPGERNNERYLIPHVKNAPKVMIWGAICARGRSGLWFMPEGTTINGATYLEVLQDKLPQFMAIQGCDSFQQDGAPCHQTKAVKDWLQRSNINLVGPWPGNSPDLNPIENCWAVLKRKVAEKNPTSIASLKDAIKTVWVKEISPELCQKLSDSMQSRIASVLENHGHHTKY